MNWLKRKVRLSRTITARTSSGATAEPDRAPVMMDAGAATVARIESEADETSDVGVRTTERPTTGVASEDFLNRGRGQLAEEEISSPAGRRWLIAELDRLRRDNENLQKFKDNFHVKDKENAVLTLENAALKRTDFTRTACLGVGCAGLGAAASYITISALGWLFFVLFALLTVISLTPRLWK